jgi:beta-lactamase family protein
MPVRRSTTRSRSTGRAVVRHTATTTAIAAVALAVGSAAPALAEPSEDFGDPPAGASPKLTQIYRGDDGGALYLRAAGTKVVGFAEHPGRNYALVFRGTRTKDLIKGSWYDVAKGSRSTVGTIVLKIYKQGDRLVRGGGSGFGPDAFNAIAAGSFPWPGAREAGFQSRSRSDMDGAFIGRTVAREPDGSRHYWRETASGAFGVAESAAKAGKRPAWVSVFFGKREAGGDVSGEYFDVPKGTESRSGHFVLRPRKFGREYALGLSAADRPPTTGIEADYALDFDKIADAVDKHFDKKVVGFGWAISSDGNVVRSGGGGSAYLSEGKNGFDINQPFSSGTESPTASTTKLVTATAIMQVLAKRGMSIKSPVYPHYPDCWKLGLGMMSLTFERLLNQSSGLFRPSEKVKAEDAHLFVMKAAEAGLTGDKGYENMNYTHLGWLLAGLLDKPAVEASFAKHGCGKATKAYGETMDIYGDYVIDMLADEGVAAGWNYRTGLRSLKYDFKNQSLAGVLPVSTVPNPTGGLMINASEFGEFLGRLEHGRFVNHATVKSMKDGGYGFDDLTENGGSANTFLASDGLGLAKRKNGGCRNDKGRSCGSQLVMLPGDVQIVALFNSGNNATSNNANGLRNAWQTGIK